MSKLTAKEITYNAIEKDINLVERERSICTAADMHSIIHLMSATDNSYDDRAMKVANKVIDFLRTIQEEEKDGCLALTIQAIRMGLCCWINDTMDEAREKVLFDHIKN